jgi:hypothetical protein
VMLFTRRARAAGLATTLGRTVISLTVTAGNFSPKLFKSLSYYN